MPKVLPSRYCASTIGALSILQSDINKKNLFCVLLVVLFPNAEPNLEELASELRFKMATLYHNLSAIWH